MAGGSVDDDSEISDINVTPLVDVVLVLLIIFMVTTSQIVHNTIDVNLPKADTGESKNTTKNLALVLDQQSNLYVDGKPKEFEELADLITTARTAATEEKQTLQALITADQQTPHGAVVKLIDAVRKNGITDFAINVEAPQ